MKVKRIAILGSTGSIGQKALRVIDALNTSGLPRRAARRDDDVASQRVAGTAGKPQVTSYEIVALSANSSIELLAEQARRYKPKFVAVTDPDYYHELKELTGNLDTTILAGPDSLVEIAQLAEVDIVFAAVVGAAGLPAVLAAAKKGKTLAVANKEPLVIAGELLTRTIKENGGIILPVDSEHSAIFQAMQAGARDEVSKIILTASGGPFRTASLDDMSSVTLEETLAHPVWDMGPKITIDSATMMNKALEVIEARWLFDVGVERIEVLIHPESIVHSLVEFIDGSVIAQLGTPDMCLPIQYALTYPLRLPGIAEHLRLDELGQLTFEKPNLKVFRALALGFEVAKTDGTAAVVFNAANEAAVGEFLEGRIKFVNIVELIEHCLDKHSVKTGVSLEELLEIDAWARREVIECLKQKVL
jgi:1-deoxy-D-xylulose-5-phosphate reductoisomerase